jgi:hypothetical protein
MRVAVNLPRFQESSPQRVADLGRHPGFHLHFIPTSCSWLNMVERFFRDLPDKCIRRGVFHSVPELEEAIRKYVQGHNQHPKPYLWTAKARDIKNQPSHTWQTAAARLSSET